MISASGKQFTCDEFPMIWGLERQLALAEEYGTKPQLEYCGCGKTGDGKVYCYGFCEDAFAKNSTKKQTGKRKTGRAYRRNHTRHKKARRRAIVASGGCTPTIGYADYGFVDGKWVETGNHIKCPKQVEQAEILKKISNKKDDSRENFPAVIRIANYSITGGNSIKGKAVLDDEQKQKRDFVKKARKKVLAKILQKRISQSRRQGWINCLCRSSLAKAIRSNLMRIKIIARKEYERLNPRYKEFVEANRDTVFTAHLERGVP